MELYSRLARHSREFGRVFSQRELMTRFQRGLLAHIRPLLRSVRKIFTGSNALADFSEHADAIRASHTAIKSKDKPILSRALLVEEDTAPAPRNTAQQAYPTDAMAFRWLHYEFAPPSRTATPTVE